MATCWYGLVNIANRLLLHNNIMHVIVNIRQLPVKKRNIEFVVFVFFSFSLRIKPHEDGSNYLHNFVQYKHRNYDTIIPLIYISENMFCMCVTHLLIACYLKSEHNSFHLWKSSILYTFPFKWWSDWLDFWTNSRCWKLFRKPRFVWDVCYRRQLLFQR